MEVARQIRYYVKTDTAEQEVMRHLWIVCIINQQKEIERIQEKLLKTLARVDEFTVIVENLINKSRGMHYKVLGFKSKRWEMSCEERKETYDVPRGQFKLDRELSRLGEPVDEWFEENYIPAILRR